MSGTDWIVNPTSASGAPVAGYAPQAGPDGLLPLSISPVWTLSVAGDGALKPMAYGGPSATGSTRMIIPLGWILHLYAITAHSSTTLSGQTIDVVPYVDGVSAGASWDTLQLTAAIQYMGIEPIATPYVVDATSAEKLLLIGATNSAGSARIITATMFGHMFRA